MRGVGGGETEAATLRVFEILGSFPRQACAAGGSFALKGDGYASADDGAAFECS